MVFRALNYNLIEIQTISKDRVTKKRYKRNVIIHKKNKKNDIEHLKIIK